MFPRINNRNAISAVLTTIIILVASIVLGTGVVVYSTSLFQSGGSQQAVQVQGLKGWVSNSTTGYSWGAFAVKNTGDKLVSINSITLRGVAVPYTNMYSDINQTRTSANFQSQLITTGIDVFGNMKTNIAYGGGSTSCPGYSAPNNVPNEITINENGTNDVIIGTADSRVKLCLQEQSGPLSLLPGNIAIIYFKNPNGLYGTTDVGVTSTISVLAGTAPVAQTIRLGSS